MLGKFMKIDLREIWKHEAINFTKWLAQEENIKLLGDEIGLDIQVIKTEASVGSFSVDILAEETSTGKSIIIENQLEQTNHDHLGKIITYASGLEASYIIWVFKQIREEHRRAIDWLNEITTNEVNFFAVQLELWKIDDSLPAPKFNIISSPNDWAKAIKASKDNENLSENNLFQLEFWQGFIDYMQNKQPYFQLGSSQSKHWLNAKINSSQAHISFIVSVKFNFIRCDLYIPKNKELFYVLFNNKTEIETELSFEMDWQELPNAQASRIAIRKDMTNVKDPGEMIVAYRWYHETGDKLAKVFSKYIH
jgi:hypothetical protein